MLVVLLAHAAPAAAKPWRGVVPLSSTRADVERLLGQPKHKGDGWRFYDLRDEAAVVWFADGRCDDWGIKWNVPEGTVTHVGVVPKRRVRVSALLDPSKAETENKTRDYAVYRDKRTGIIAEAQSGHVVVATFKPGRADSSRRCPAKEKPPFGHPHQFPFDQYGRILHEVSGRASTITPTRCWSSRQRAASSSLTVGGAACAAMRMRARRVRRATSCASAASSHGGSRRLTADTRNI
jgi:hypothetical protein